MMIIGDMNIDLLKTKELQANREYLNLLNSHGMTSVINNNPTREEILNDRLVKSALDHIFLRHVKNVKLYSGIVTCKISDHCLTLAAFYSDRVSLNDKQNDLKYKDVVQFGKFKAELQKISEQVSLEENCIVEEFYNNLLETVENAKIESTVAIRRKCYTDSNKPWITESILEMIKSRDQLFKKWKNARSRIKNIIRQEYNRMRNKVETEINTAKLNYY